MSSATMARSPRSVGAAGAPAWAAPASAVVAAAERREELGLVEQEGVVAFVGLDLDEAHVGGGGVEGVHDHPVLGCGIEPVAGEGDHAEARAGAAEGVRE